jgi:hypothetical protein
LGIHSGYPDLCLLLLQLPASRAHHPLGRHYYRLVAAAFNAFKNMLTSRCNCVKSLRVDHGCSLLHSLVVDLRSFGVAIENR